MGSEKQQKDLVLGSDQKSSLLKVTNAALSRSEPASPSEPNVKSLDSSDNTWQVI